MVKTVHLLIRIFDNEKGLANQNWWFDQNWSDLNRGPFLFINKLRPFNPKLASGPKWISGLILLINYDQDAKYGSANQVKPVFVVSGSLIGNIQTVTYFIGKSANKLTANSGRKDIRGITTNREARIRRVKIQPRYWSLRMFKKLFFLIAVSLFAKDVATCNWLQLSPAAIIVYLVYSKLHYQIINVPLTLLPSIASLLLSWSFIIIQEGPWRPSTSSSSRPSNNQNGVEHVVVWLI